MAIMGRRKKATAQGWNAINKQREKEAQSKEVKEEINQEEHEERLKKLREIGLIN